MTYGVYNDCVAGQMNVVTGAAEKRITVLVLMVYGLDYLIRGTRHITTQSALSIFPHGISGVTSV